MGEKHLRSKKSLTFPKPTLDLMIFSLLINSLNSPMLINVFKTFQLVKYFCCYLEFQWNFLQLHKYLEINCALFVTLKNSSNFVIIKKFINNVCCYNLVNVMNSDSFYFFYLNKVSLHFTIFTSSVTSSLSTKH